MTALRTLCFISLACLATPQAPQFPPPEVREEGKLPNGKNQKDEILKADHAKNLVDADKLIQLSGDLKASFEKNSGFVFSLEDVKRLDEIEKLAKRMRSRIRRN